MTTTIYLDVDGVLNAVTHKSPYLTAAGWDRWDGWKSAPVNGYPILWAPALIEALNQLAAREDVTFKWLTTWQHDAAKVLSPVIGINGHEWGVLEGDMHGWKGKAWWKLEQIRADVEATRPEKFVWIDDDLSLESEALAWVAGHPEGIAISPYMREGLTRSDVESVTAFIDAEAEVAV